MTAGIILFTSTLEQSFPSVCKETCLTDHWAASATCTLLWHQRESVCHFLLLSNTNNIHTVYVPSSLHHFNGATVRSNLAYPVLEKQFHRPCPWLQRSRLKTRLKSRYRWRLSTSGSLQIRCSTERTFVRTMSNTWATEKVKDGWGRESDRDRSQTWDIKGN